MSIRAAFRFSGAWWFLPVMLAVGTVFPMMNNVIVVGYPTGDLSIAGTGLGYNGPLLAAVAAYAWRGWAPFHRPLRTTRSGPLVLMTSGWPLLVGGPLVGCLAIVGAARSLPNDRASWVLLSLFFVVLLCCAMLGVAFSWALPAVLSVPIAAGATFVWINYLAATNSPRLHHLTPPINGFATVSQPATSAVVAVMLLSLTVIAGLVLVLALTRWDRQRRLVNGALVAAVLAAACALAWSSLSWSSQRLNLLAAEPRTTPLQCADHGEVEVCLWPESASRSDEVAAAAIRVNSELRDWALPEILRVSAGPATAGVTGVDATPGSSTPELTLSLARGYLSQRLGCEVIGDRETDQRVTLLAVAVTGPDALEPLVAPDTLAQATQQLLKPPTEIRHWFEAGLSAMRCFPQAMSRP